MKKFMLTTFIVAFLAISIFGLSACFKPKTKEFSGSGMTVTLTDDFVEKEVLQAQLYLESTKSIFMGNAETKAFLVDYGITDLRTYTQKVLELAGKTSVEIFEYNEGGVRFDYAYYDATVDLNEFGYMLITMEGESNYYTMDFGCKKANLESNKEQFMAWAKLIKVE